jgi:hypothetical protein
VDVGPGGPEEGVGLVYDVRDAVLISVNLTGEIGAPVQTWTYNGTWLQVPIYFNASGDSGLCAGPFYSGHLAYDPDDGYVLGLFGDGMVSCVEEFRDFNWTPLPEPPGTVRIEGMTYDTGLHRFVLVGPNMTWTFADGNWTDLSSESAQPPPSLYPAVVYDPVDGYTVLFGGSAPATGNSSNSTWALTGDQWSNITSESPIQPPNYVWTVANTTVPASSYDSDSGFDLLDGYLVLLHEPARGFPVTTWTFAHGVWTNVTARLPFIPTFAVGYMAYNSSSNTLVFWSISVGMWWWAHYGPLAISLSISPGKIDLGMTAELRTTVSGGLLPYTYMYQGIPSPCLNYPGPVFSCDPGFPGSYVIRVNVSDWVGEYETASAGLVVDPPLGLLGVTGTPNLLDVGQPLAFNVTVNAGTPPYAFAYSGLPPGCPNLNASSVNCIPDGSGQFGVQVTVRDAVGNSQSVSTSVEVLPAVQLASFSVTPANVTLGGNVTFRVVAGGGTGILTFAYFGLPPNCTVGNRSAILCTPSSPGVYTVHVSITDTLGESIEATTTLTVVVATHPGHGASGWGLETVALIALGILLVAVAVAAFWRRRRTGGLRRVYPS